MRPSWIVILIGCSSPTTGPTKPNPTPEESPTLADTGVRPTLERPPPVGNADAAPLIGVMQQELVRSLDALKGKPDAPYFLAYQITALDSLDVRSSFGALLSSSKTKRRVLDVDVRVGDHRRDNTHPLRDAGFEDWEWGGNAVEIPLADDPVAIKAALWKQTHEQLRAAQQKLLKVQAQAAIKVKEEDDSDDFSREAPTVYFEKVPVAEIDRAAWEKKINAYSAIFRGYPQIHASEVSLSAGVTTRYFVNSEGTRVQTSRPSVRIFVEATTVADDGMQLRRYESFYAPSIDRLAPEQEIRASIDALIKDLLALRSAPLAEPFAGPAILEGQAAAVYFHEVFGHRMEGHRQKDEEEGQTFARKINQPVMPDFMDVFDDPSVRSLDGTPLNGFYRVDDEGVVGQKANLVEGGVLKTFLLSRAPTRGFTKSNGHGRRQEGYRIVARQGNLIVSPRRTVSRDALTQLLVEEVKKQQKPYGLRFKQVEGGFTMTGRWGPQGWKVLPLIVYRVYPDGREELIRGADLEGTPLTSLSKIVAAADDWRIFNGHCGAESGMVPVSGASPSLLVGQVEIARKSKEQDKPPILPPPPVGGEK